MKKISLGNGNFTIVDDEDYEKLNQFRWYKAGRGYVLGRMGTKKVLKMHRVITNAPKGMEVDHKNRNKLDNRKTNLQIVTHIQNMQNIKKSTSGIEKTTGKRKMKYVVRVSYMGKRYYGGYFKTLAEAKQARKNLCNTILRKTTNFTPDTQI